MDSSEGVAPGAPERAAYAGDSLAHAGPGLAPARHTAAIRWLIHDLPFITMLLLALVAVAFRLPVVYWVILIPVFGVISVAAGWRHFAGREARLDLVVRQALSWCALLAAIYLLYSTGVQGVLNANASALSVMTLLALGTFVAGLQAKVWQICAVGGVLFLAVPALGWLAQSPLLLTAAVLGILVLAALAWWFTARSGPVPR